MRPIRLKLLVLLGVLLFLQSFHVAIAQSPPEGTCPAIVDEALTAAEQECSDLSRNSACYGNAQLSAEPRSDTENFTFDSVGDTAAVNDIETLQLSPMDEESGQWGVALMQLQASLPGTLPGQNVTFVLFGDVTLTNAVTAEQVENGEFAPMQAFYLSTGIGQSRCEEAPEDGVLVQTPEGVGEVTFVVNEVEVAVGSTVFFQAEAGGEMRFSTLEGAATLKLYDDVVPVIAGTWVSFPVDENLRPRERADDFDVGEMIQTYTEDRFDSLPLNLLEREIDIRDGLTEDELDSVRERLRSQEPLCGDDDGLLPACEELPAGAGGNPCTFDDDGERPLCERFDELELDLEDAARPFDEDEDETILPGLDEERESLDLPERPESPDLPDSDVVPDREDVDPAPEVVPDREDREEREEDEEDEEEGGERDEED